MPITLDDIRRERERRLQDPSSTLAPMAQQPEQKGVTLQDIQAERARRRASGFDPFHPVDAVPGPSGDRRVNVQAEAIQPAINPAEAIVGGAGAGIVGGTAARIGGALMGATGLAPDTLGPTAGEIAGGTLGTLAGPIAPVASPVLASVGAGVGLAVSRWLQGEPVTTQELTGEALTTLIPEVAVQGGKAVLRASTKARRARFADLAQQARREASEVFHPPEAGVVNALFNQVAESGVRVDTGAMQKFIGSIGSRYDDLLKEVRRIDTSLKTGGQFEDLVTRIQGGQKGAYDIGRLQTLRSELRKRRGITNMPYEAQELLGDFQDAVDDSIFNGLAKGQNAAQAGTTRDTLRVARAGYAKLRRTEELQGLVESAITSEGSGTGVKISLGRIRDSIRKGTGRAGRSIQRGFEHDPTSKHRFYDFLDRLGTQHESISVSLADLPPHTLGASIAKIGEWMATIYTSIAGQKAFEELVVSGHGRLTHSTLANVANVARREVAEESEERRTAP